MKRSIFFILILVVLSLVTCEKNSTQPSEDSPTLKTGVLNFNLSMTDAPSEVVVLKGYLSKLMVS